MFKFKAKKDRMTVLKDTLMSGRETLSQNMGRGLKDAGKKIEYIGKYVKDNESLSAISSVVSKNPAGSIMAVIGIGLTVFGIASFMKK